MKKQSFLIFAFAVIFCFLIEKSFGQSPSCYSSTSNANFNNLQPCRCWKPESPLSSYWSDGCGCHATDYGTTLPDSCTDPVITQKPITCKSQCGNGYRDEVLAPPYIGFWIYQKPSGNCTDCWSDYKCNDPACLKTLTNFGTLTGSFARYCREGCDFGTVGFYNAVDLTCCPSNCGWDGRSATSALVTQRSINTVFDRFNVVPRYCYTVADCPTASGWTTTCESEANGWGWCKHVPTAGTLPAAPTGQQCPTLPCYTTSNVGGSCLLNTNVNNINNVLNGGANTGYGIEPVESGFYCQKPADYYCWSGLTCGNGYLKGSTLTSGTAVMNPSTTLSVGCGTTLTHTQFGFNTSVPSNIGYSFGPFVVSTTCPANVLTTFSNATALYLTFTGSSTDISCSVTLGRITQCRQLLSATRNVVVSCCGNNVTGSGEVCDSGSLLGFIPSGGTSCCQNCSSVVTIGTTSSATPLKLIQAKKCTSPAQCNDLNTETTDRCISGWCVNDPTPNNNKKYTSSCSLSPCPEIPCYNFVCTNGAFAADHQCSYTTGNNINYLSKLYCKNETACAHSTTCTIDSSTVAYQTYTVPSYTVSVNTIPSPTCGGSVSVFPYINTVWSNTSPVFGAPSVSYQVVQTSVGAVSTTISNTNNNPTISFGSVYNTSGSNTITFNLISTSSCGVVTTTPFSITVLCCGDGIVQSGEQCDLGPLNGNGTTCCSSTCTFRAAVTCRNATTLCNAEARCPGNSAICPANPLKTPGTVCIVVNSNDLSSCYTNWVCSVTGTCDPRYKSSGTFCNRDNNLCTNDFCDGAGNCNFGFNQTYDDKKACNGLESCNPATGTKVSTPPINCSDSNSCTTDTCIDLPGGNYQYTCSNTPSPGTTGSCGVSSVGQCKLGSLVCDGTGPTPNVTCVGAVYPSTELCIPPLVDENCNGLVDEGCNTVPCVQNSDCANVSISSCQTIFCNASNVCEVAFKPSGSSCNDGLGCTINDKCNSQGVCAGTPYVCPAGNNSCIYGYCSEPLGQCLYDLSYYTGSPCPCSSTSCLNNCTCSNQGQCNVGTPVVCPPTGNQCQVSSCTSTGQCEISNIVGACDDGLPCTIGDQCIDGECAGIQVNIDDGIPCTIDACDPLTGEISNVLDSGSCLINNVCYTHGTANPSNPCEFCDTSVSIASWTFTSLSNVSCDDGLRCTIDDKCVFATASCVGTPLDCSSFGDDCNTASCVEQTGTCVLTPVPNGQSCPSLEYCIIDKQCHDGSCVGGVPRNCSLYDTQCTIYTCDENLNQCTSTNLPDYTNCILNDDFCDGSEICLSGQCVHGDPPVPPPSGPCYSYTCDPLLGFIRVNSPGLPCTDNNDCTSGDVCNVFGECEPGSLISCNDNNGCTIDSCLAVGGCIHTEISNCQTCSVSSDCTPKPCHTVVCDGQNTCVYTPVQDGFSCSDGNQCNGEEICGDSGTCFDGSPLVCTPPNPCFDAFCSPASGCYYVADTTNTFSMGDPCIVNERCGPNGEQLYDPYQCPENDDCHIYSCVSIDNQPVCVAEIRVNNTCDDANSCTLFDKCNQAGVCQGEPVQCPPPTQCEESINCVNGVCETVYKTAGTPCDNGNLCFENICDGQGMCINGDPLVVCEAIGQCYQQGVCVPNLGICTTPLLPDGTSCSTGNLCDVLPTCQQGNCVPQETLQCITNNQCESAGFCNRTTQACEYPPVPDNTPCDTGNKCASLSVCINRQCTDANFVVCNNSNPCVDAFCDEDIGCVYTNNQDPCFNENKCFENYQCVDGDCPVSSGTPVDCNDGNPCTVDSCYPHVGCVHSIITDCFTCTANATLFGGAPECPPIPCKKAYCSDTGACYYVNDNTQVQGCADGIFCNGEETCHDGDCQHGLPPSCDDFNECTVDTCDADLNGCKNTIFVGTECNILDKCVYHASCSAQGQCVPDAVVTCLPPVDECQVLIGCDSETGICGYQNIADDTPCTSSNLCATESKCRSGRCEVLSTKHCDPQNQCYLQGVCDPHTGVCPEIPKPDHTPCDDGYGCTVGDKCESGTCVSGLSYCDNIAYDEQCQEIICVEGTEGPSCEIINLDGQMCDDGLPDGPCTKRKVCSAGQCVREYLFGQECRGARNFCDLPEVCGNGDECPPDLYKTNGTSCPDNLFCTDNTCQAGFCVPTIEVPLPSPPSECTYYTCSETLGSFVLQNRADGTSCNAEIVGQCIDHYECRTGSCSLVPKSSTTPCDDGNNCTLNDRCSGVSQVCVPGTPKDCSSLNSQCSIGVCNAPFGNCVAQAFNEGGSCNADNNPCTPLDKCVNKVCVPGEVKNCTYLNSNCGVGACRIVNTTFGECFLNVTNPNCNPDYCIGGCVLSFGYWSTHTSQSKTKSQKIPWPFNSESKVLCGKTWYQWSQEKSDKLAWIKLFDQWFAATLNRYIGACMSFNMNITYTAATTLLNQCQTTIQTSSSASTIYKNYAATLEAYNSGTMSPQSCSSKYIEGRTARSVEEESDNGFGDEIDESNVDRTYPLNALFGNSIIPSDCINGIYDFVLSSCDCYYGWGGASCAECGIPTEEDHTYLCVPTPSGDPQYVLQSISNEKVSDYLSGNVPVLLKTTLDVLYPNTNGLDCTCASTDQSNNQERDIDINILLGPKDTYTSVIISYLQDEIEEYQGMIDINITIASNCSNETIVIEIETDDDDWVFADHLWWIVPLIVAGSFLLVFLVIYLFSRPTEEYEVIGSMMKERPVGYHHKRGGYYVKGE